jgi:hypothetical protein
MSAGRLTIATYLVPLVCYTDTDVSQTIHSLPGENKEGGPYETWNQQWNSLVQGEKP